MTDAWADVDAWAEEQLAPVRAQYAVESRSRDETRVSQARRNVDRWLRELAPDLVHALLIPDSPGKWAIGWHTNLEAVLVANDWLLERGLWLKTPRPRRPSTPDERALLDALKACRFPLASQAKRFVRELDPSAVTDRQIINARLLVTKFRRQISAEALHEADRHLLSKPKKSQR